MSGRCVLCMLMTGWHQCTSPGRMWWRAWGSSRGNILTNFTSFSSNTQPSTESLQSSFFINSSYRILSDGWWQVPQALVFQERSLSSAATEKPNPAPLYASPEMEIHIQGDWQVELIKQPEKVIPDNLYVSDSRNTDHLAAKFTANTHSTIGRDFKQSRF